MKLMYSIIIVIILVVVVFLLLKRTPATPAETSYAVEENPSAMMEEVATEEAASATAETTKPSDSKELQMTVVKTGTGDAVSKDGDVLAVHYTGYLEDGTKFDSSVDRGTPFMFTLGSRQVIPGWEIGMKGMKVGEVRKLTIPSLFAYGDRGVPGVIPANATLVFDVELLAINPKDAQ